MKKTFMIANLHKCVGADDWHVHSVVADDHQISLMYPIEDRSVVGLGIGETYINKDKSRIVTRIA